MIAATYNVHRCVGRDRVRAPERTAAVIRELDADIVALQEVSEPGQLEQLVGHELLFGETMPGYGNALVSRLPMQHVHALDLSFRKREPRGALHVRIGELHVIASHLGLERRERRHQLSEIVRYAHALSPLLILGDFNEWLPLRGLLGETAVLRSWPTPLPALPLDRLWVRVPGTVPRFSVHKSALAKVASDHFPVRVVF